MTNYEKILKTSLYDLLMGINVAICCDSNIKCVKQLLTYKYQFDCDKPTAQKCGECIQKWLNEEARQ